MRDVRSNRVPEAHAVERRSAVGEHGAVEFPECSAPQLHGSARQHLVIPLESRAIAAAVFFLVEICAAVPRESVQVACAVAVKSEQERSEEHTSELQSQSKLVCRLLLEK